MGKLGAAARHDVLTMPIRELDVDKALCRNTLDPEQFFVDGLDNDEDKATTQRAIAICKRPCPILEECFLFAYQNRIEYGVYGATTSRQRLKMWRKHGRVTKENVGRLLAELRRWRS